MQNYEFSGSTTFFVTIKANSHKEAVEKAHKMLDDMLITKDLQEIVALEECRLENVEINGVKSNNKTLKTFQKLWTDEEEYYLDAPSVVTRMITCKGT